MFRNRAAAWAGRSRRNQAITFVLGIVLCAVNLLIARHDGDTTFEAFCAFGVVLFAGFLVAVAVQRR